MRPRGSDAKIDKLYQLPLDEFTAARNALAREAGSDRAEIARLPKPPLAAWAVNQLYWQDRAAYDSLMDAATALRSAHKAVLGGRRGDLRAASKAHDEALDHALKATLELLTRSGHKVTDATRQAVLNTLRALPTADPAGRLARTLQPGGFEMLAAFDVAAPQTPAARRSPVGSPKPSARKETKPAKDDRRAAAERRTAARQLVTDRTREAREAETELRRQEFAAARAGKEAERAAARLEQAREALAAAEHELDEAKRAVSAAAKARDQAQRDAIAAQGAVATARARLDEAQRALDDLE